MREPIETDAGAALGRFIARVEAASTAEGRWPPRAEHDLEWPLSCALGPPENGLVRWAPTLRTTPLDLTELERAHGPLHAGVRGFFGSFWSLLLTGLHFEEPVSLTLFESPAREAETRRAWLAGGPSSSLCVAHFGDDRWVGLDPRTGRASLEDPGREARVIAASLAEWLDQLEAVATT